MNDTQRLDWLERNPDRLLVVKDWSGGNIYKFSILIEMAQRLPEPTEHKWSDTKYSHEYDTLREALDEGMKRIL